MESIEPRKSATLNKDFTPKVIMTLLGICLVMTPLGV